MNNKTQSPNSIVMFNKNDVPENWNVKKINECCDILDSKRIPLNSQERRKRHGTIPYYGANGVQDYINDYIFDDELILLAEDGGNFLEFQTKPIAYRINDKSWVNNHAHVLKNKSDHDLDFIFYSLVHKNIIPWINGTTRSKLNQSELREIEILTPPLEEQQKIAFTLSNLDKLISYIQNELKHIQKIKKESIQEFLVTGTNKVKLKKIDSDFGITFKCPENWQYVKLMDLAKSKEDIIAGPFGSNLKVNDYCKKGIPIIRIQNVQRNQFIDDNIQYIAEKKAKELAYHSYLPNDLVLAKLGNPIGKTCTIPSNFPSGIVTADVVRIRISSKDYDQKFLEYVLNSKICEKQLYVSKVGTTRPRVNLSDIRDLSIPLPPLEEQREMVKIFSNLDILISKMREELTYTKKTKVGLMQKLLTGQIRVPLS